MELFLGLIPALPPPRYSCRESDSAKTEHREGSRGLLPSAPSQEVSLVPAGHGAWVSDTTCVVSGKERADGHGGKATG